MTLPTSNSDTWARTIFGAMIVAALVFGAFGCQPQGSNCREDSDCASGFVCASGGGLLVPGGVCVTREAAAQDDVGPGQDTQVEPDIKACEPSTCEAIGASCGVVDDGCGAPLRCGAPTCIASLSAGPQHSCAVFGDGRIFCWGANQGGQLGSGDFEPRPTPTPVLMSSVDFDAQQVSAGMQHSCALNQNGLVWCWGSNKLVGSGDCFGQLGTGDDCATLPRTNRPAIAVDRALVEPQVIALQTRDNFNCMRNHTGQAYCWGSGAHGQVGNAESLAANIAPQPVQGYDAAIFALGLSQCYACGLAESGLVCWGDVAQGCAGEGAHNQAELAFGAFEFEPNACATPDGCIAGGRAHTCFLDASATPYCFNDNTFGQLGVDPEETAHSSTPVQVTGLAGFVTQLTAGDRFSCALQSDGEVYCWGENNSGQLGDGSQVASFRPVKVGLSGAATRISAGGAHACAALESGEIQCWGDNAHGQLGDGNSGIGQIATTPVTTQF